MSNQAHIVRLESPLRFVRNQGLKEPGQWVAAKERGFRQAVAVPYRCNGDLWFVLLFTPRYPDDMHTVYSKKTSRDLRNHTENEFKNLENS